MIGEIKSTIVSKVKNQYIHQHTVLYVDLNI